MVAPGSSFRFVHRRWLAVPLLLNLVAGGWTVSDALGADEARPNVELISARYLAEPSRPAAGPTLDRLASVDAPVAEAPYVRPAVKADTQPLAPTRVPVARLRAQSSARADATLPPPRDGWETLGPRIRGCESWGSPTAPGNYLAKNPRSTASGAYQVLDGTWNGAYGVPKALMATPEQQEAFARALYDVRGTAPWRASQRCWA